MFGFTTEIRAVIVGAHQGIGQALAEKLLETEQCTALILTSRKKREATSAKAQWCQLDITAEENVIQVSKHIAPLQPNLIINCTGLLHGANFGPEKTWRHIQFDVLQSLFAVNASGVALLGKHFLPLLPRRDRSIFASLSARVGSISDNQLGGWYGYRASKAAQNMFIKCLAIEAQRKYPDLVCVGLHPGTVATSLSEPFTKNYTRNPIFSPMEAAEYIEEVLSARTPEDSGQLFAWDGKEIPF